MLLIAGGCRVSEGIGGGGTIFVGDCSIIDEKEDRIAEAGAPCCENGLPGPFGASAKD